MRTHTQGKNPMNLLFNARNQKSFPEYMDCIRNCTNVNNKDYSINLTNFFFLYCGYTEKESPKLDL